MCTQLGYQLADASSQYIFLYTSKLLRRPYAAAQLTGTCTVCPAQRSPLRNHNWFACIVYTADTHDARGCNNIRMLQDLQTSVTFTKYNMNCDFKRKIISQERLKRDNTIAFKVPIYN